MTEQPRPISPAILHTRHVDHAVRNVMSLGRIPQGYMGTIEVNRPAVRAWFDQGAPLNAWWWAFVAAVQAEHRRLRRA